LLPLRQRPITTAFLADFHHRIASAMGKTLVIMPDRETTMLS
jgi:hypothetical protein